MTLNADSSPTSEPSPPTAATSAAASPSRLRHVFLDPKGIRVGWRLLLFFVFLFAIGGGLQFGLGHIAVVTSWAKAQPRGTLTPTFHLFNESNLLIVLFLAAFIMSKIEKRTFSDYGLPARGAFGGKFWLGVGLGFAEVTLLVGLIAAFHGFSLGTLAIGGEDIIKYGAIWGVGFLLVGFFEEFSFRGYLQYTLGSGIGFWPAALVLSLLFGGIHLTNPGEAWVGALMAGSFGVLAAFSLERTGSLWLAIGMHAAFDWGETFLYSVPDSGLLAQGRLLNSSFHGARWLTGGSVGPEGSVFAFVTLLIAAGVIHRLYPARRS